MEKKQGQRELCACTQNGVLILPFWAGCSKLEKGVPSGTPSSENYKPNSSWLKPEMGFLISVSENVRACQASGTAESRCSRSIGLGLSLLLSLFSSL